MTDGVYYTSNIIKQFMLTIDLNKKDKNGKGYNDYDYNQAK